MYNKIEFQGVTSILKKRKDKVIITVSLYYTGWLPNFIDEVCHSVIKKEKRLLTGSVQQWDQEGWPLLYELRRARPSLKVPL